MDDLDRVLAILEETGYREERFYIHCDGALFGLMVRSMKAHMPLPACCRSQLGCHACSGHVHTTT